MTNKVRNVKPEASHDRFQNIIFKRDKSKTDNIFAYPRHAKSSLASLLTELSQDDGQ